MLPLFVVIIIDYLVNRCLNLAFNLNSFCKCGSCKFKQYISDHNDRAKNHN